MKKLIALLLCLAILLSLCSVAMATTAFAPSWCQKPEAINYVALGDSTSVGYYLGEYFYSHQHNGKYPVSGEFSEYRLFMEYLTGKYSNVTGTDLTMTGMRPIFLRAILDTSEFTKIATRPASIADAGFASHIGTINGEYDNGGEYVNPTVAAALNKNAYNGLSGNPDSMHEIFSAALKNANLISYDMFLIDTSINLLSDLSSLNSTTPTSKFADLMAEENCPWIAAGANALKLTLQSVLRADSALSGALITVNNLIDDLLFIYADLVLNFHKNMEWIYSNNHNDPTVIIVMPSNCFPNVDVQLGGISVSLTRLMDCLLSAVNAYLIKGDSYAGRYYLADCSDANETCIAAYGQGVFNTEHPEYADYANLWHVTEGYLINPKLAELTAPTTFADLTGEEQAQIKANFAAACDLVYNPKNHIPIDLTNLAGTFSDNPDNALFDGIDRTFFTTVSHTDRINYSRDDDPVIAADQRALVLALGDILLMGIHPSAQCCRDKAKAIEKAFESCYTANAFCCVRRADFALNSLGALLGNRKCAAAVSSALSHFLKPIIFFTPLNIFYS